MMVDMIVQNVSHSGRTRLSFTVPREDLDQCLLLTREVLEQWDNVELSFDRDIAKLSIMGIGLRSHTGVGDRAFRVLSEAGHQRAAHQHQRSPHERRRRRRSGQESLGQTLGSLRSRRSPPLDNRQ